MDTREKIKTGAEIPALLQRGRWSFVVGLFDPLTAIQAERLAVEKHHGRELLAIVLRDEESLLPPEARAQMVAALRSVTAVAVADRREWRNWLASDSDVRVIEDEAAERKRSTDFVAFVLGRQVAAEAGGKRT